MSTLAVTYNNFVNGTPANADQVDQNFTDVVNYINTEAIVRDGTVAMTQPLGLKAGTDPTSADHAARKAYIDNLIQNRKPKIEHANGGSGPVILINPTASICSVTMTCPPVAGFYFVQADGWIVMRESLQQEEVEFQLRRVNDGFVQHTQRSGRYEAAGNRSAVPYSLHAWDWFSANQSLTYEVLAWRNIGVMPHESWRDIQQAITIMAFPNA